MLPHQINENRFTTHAVNPAVGTSVGLAGVNALEVGSVDQSDNAAGGGRIQPGPYLSHAESLAPLMREAQHVAVSSRYIALAKFLEIVERVAMDLVRSLGGIAEPDAISAEADIGPAGEYLLGHA